MPIRRGISLVELMLTLSACCVIVTMSAALIHRAMHAQSKSRRFFDGERNAQRLGESFRRDVHAATSAATGAEAGGGDVFVRLEMSGGQTVEYRQAAGRVERTWHVDGSIRAREAFVFPAETRLMADKELPRLVILAVAPQGTTAASAAPAKASLDRYATPLSLRVEAVLGRHAALMDAPVTAEQSP